MKTIKNQIKKYCIALYRDYKKYRELLTPYIMMLFIPLLLCIALIVAIFAVTTAQIETLGQRTAENFRSMSSAAINEVYYLSDTLCNDESFLQLLSSPDTDRTSLVYSSVCDKINNHISRSKYVGQVNVFCRKQNSIYSPACRYNFISASSLLSQFSKTLTLEDLPHEEGWHLLSPDYVWPYYITNIYSRDGSDLLGTMVISIDTSSFFDIFTDTNADLAVMFNDDFYISSYTSPLTKAYWRQEQWVEELLGKKVRCFYIEEDSFSYLVAVSVAKFYSPLRIVVFIFAMYFLLTILLGVVFAVSASRKRYKEFMALISDLPHDPKEDLSYAQIMDTLKETTLTSRQPPNNRARKLRYILRGYYDRPLTEADLTAAGIQPLAFYRLVLFNMRSYKDIFSFDRSDNFADARRSVIEAVINSTAGQRYSAVVTNIDLVFCAVYCLPSEAIPTEQFRSTVSDVLTLLEEKYGLNVVATVSRLVSSPNEIHAAYREAEGIYKSDYLSNRYHNVIMQEDISTAADPVDSSFSQELQMLINTLLLENYSLVPSMTTALLNHHVQQPTGLYYRSTDRLSIVAGVLSEGLLCMDVDNSIKEKGVKLLSRNNSTDALIAAVNEVFAGVDSTSESASSDDLVKQACMYVAENLSDCNLSVAQICEKFGVSYPHLSRLFRKSLDSTVVGYINTSRINKAKELLLSCDATMSVIATSVGYNNTVTFTRNFKHYVGITPSYYRDLNR